MNPSVALINQPAIDFQTFLGAAHQMFGYSPATASDNVRREQSDAERFLSSLAAMRDKNASVGLPPNLLSHVSFSVFIVCDDRDLIDILNAASGMPSVSAETQARGVIATVISGTLAQWRDAVKSGASPEVERNVRSCFCKIMAMFSRVGLDGIWKDFQAKSMPDQTFYLEDKRR